MTSPDPGGEFPLPGGEFPPRPGGEADARRGIQAGRDSPYEIQAGKFPACPACRRGAVKHCKTVDFSWISHRDGPKEMAGAGV